MATANFYNQKNFDLYIKAFELISMEEYQEEYFEDSPYYDDYKQAETEGTKAKILEQAYNNDMEFWNDNFYEDIFNGYDGFKDVMEELNDSLVFHSMEFQSGYYAGVQLYIKEMENPYELDNEYCKYYYDMCRSQAIRKYEAEIRKINKWMEKIAVQYGWKKLNCLGVFSSGEAIYEYA